MDTKIKTIYLLLSLLFSFSLVADDAVKIGDVEMASEKKVQPLNKLKRNWVNGKEQWFRA